MSRSIISSTLRLELPQRQVQNCLKFFIINVHAFVHPAENNADVTQQAIKQNSSNYTGNNSPIRTFSSRKPSRGDDFIVLEDADHYPLTHDQGRKC